MPLSSSSQGTGLDDPQAIAQADAELLSLALIDARNVLLRWLNLLEQGRWLAADDMAAAALPYPAWMIGHAAWYQELMVARSLKRQQGEAADPLGPRLASVDAMADALYAVPRGPVPWCAPLEPQALRAYLASTLETTLELLGTAEPSDAGLYAYRAALLHEDRTANALAERALAAQWALPLPSPLARSDREPIWMPAQTLQLGAARDGGGFVPENERWAHAVVVPEFEIDAQVVDWARFGPFVEESGYDRRELWSEAGWAWLQASARRAPRHVEQVVGGVVLMRRGRLVKAPAAQAVMHVTRHEAEAWCRWAGRRLPTEPEWELAAVAATGRGFAWGEVFEWVGGRARAWPGHAPTPDALDRLPPESGPAFGVLRGASWLCRGRLKRRSGRRFLALDDDSVPTGFRSCAL